MSPQYTIAPRYGTYLSSSPPQKGHTPTAAAPVLGQLVGSHFLQTAKSMKKTPKTRTRVDVDYILGRNFVGRVLECGWDVWNQERRGWGGVMDVRKVIITLFNHSDEESIDLNFSGIQENHPARQRPRKPPIQHEHPIHTHSLSAVYQPITAPSVPSCSCSPLTEIGPPQLGICRPPRRWIRLCEFRGIFVTFSFRAPPIVG